MTELLVGTKKGLFRLEGDAPDAFEITARAFAGQSVEYAMRDPRTGRYLASVTSWFYGPKIWVTDDPAGEWEQAAGVEHSPEEALLPLELTCDDYSFGGEAIPALSASASHDQAGRVHLTLCHASPHQSVDLRLDVRGMALGSVQGRVLTADQMTAHNTFDAPDRVRPAGTQWIRALRAMPCAATVRRAA